MCIPIAAALAASAVVSAVGVGAQSIQGSAAAKREKAATTQAKKDAIDTKAANERAVNQANQKSPNLAAIFGNNRATTGAGVGSTTLTGPAGVNPNSLGLGRSTLLGG